MILSSLPLRILLEILQKFPLEEPKGFPSAVPFLRTDLHFWNYSSDSLENHFNNIFRTPKGFFWDFPKICSKIPQKLTIKKLQRFLQKLPKKLFLYNCLKVPWRIVHGIPLKSYPRHVSAILDLGITHSQITSDGATQKGHKLKKGNDLLVSVANPFTPLKRPSSKHKPFLFTIMYNPTSLKTLSNLHRNRPGHPVALAIN